MSGGQAGWLGLALALTWSGGCALPHALPHALPRSARSIPEDEAIVVGRVAPEGRNDWSVILETGGIDLEIYVPRGGHGVFVWSLEPGEYRVVALRRRAMEAAGIPDSASPVLTLRAPEAPWFFLERGVAYCLGTLEPVAGRRRSLVGSVAGSLRYDANCSFETLAPDDRPQARWRALPWESLRLAPVPTF